jgi:hypothetical protein
MEGLPHPVLEKSNEKDADPLTARASEGLSVMVAPPTVRTAERVVAVCVPTVTVARYCEPLSCEVRPEITRDVWVAPLTVVHVEPESPATCLSHLIEAVLPSPPLYANVSVAVVEAVETSSGWVEMTRGGGITVRVASREYAVTLHADTTARYL